MTELSREAREVLDAAREQYNPTPADKARVFAKVKAAAAATPATTAAVSTSKIALASAAILAVGLTLVATRSETNSAPSSAVNAKNFASAAGSGDGANAKNFASAAGSGDGANAKNFAAAAGDGAGPLAEDANAKNFAAAAAGAGAGDANATNFANDHGGTELEVLRAARIALRDGKNTRALELLSEHERRFTESALAEERWATRALAACTLGQYDVADRAIAALTAHAPSSEHLTRIEHACAKKSSQAPRGAATQSTP